MKHAVQNIFLQPPSPGMYVIASRAKPLRLSLDVLAGF